MVWDYLSFNRFIAQDILIFFYYIGAILVPVLLWYSRSYLIRKISLFRSADENMKNLYHTLALKYKIILWIFFLLMFLFAEIFWRMMFEMMIGYFDMHAYLYDLSQDSK